MFWSVTVSLITCDSTHVPSAQHGLVTGQWMNPLSNRNLKHVGYDTWNMCHAHVTLSGGYVSSLSTFSEGGPSGWSSANTVHSASVKLDMGSIPSASHNASSIAVALPMPIYNLSNCRCTSISCTSCKKQKEVNDSGHTRDVRMRYLRDPFVTGTQGDCRGGYKTILTKTKVCYSPAEEDIRLY